jgi:protein tyrosine/serine phosphatase
MVLYQEILEHGGAAFDAIFRHLRDHPDQPCLIHCTAGKDRTGIAVALFLMLLGVHDEYIVNDYALTTIGLAPAMPALVARFQKQAVFRDNMKGTMGMASSRFALPLSY